MPPAAAPARFKKFLRLTAFKFRFVFFILLGDGPPPRVMFQNEPRNPLCCSNGIGLMATGRGEGPVATLVSLVEY